MIEHPAGVTELLGVGETRNVRSEVFSVRVTEITQEERVWNLFPVQSIGYLYIFFGETSIQLLPIF